MKRIISSLLIVALLLLSSCAPSDKNGDDAEGVRSTIDDIPQTSTIPPYSKQYERPDAHLSVTYFTFSYEEALETYNRLKKDGVSFVSDYIAFDYRDDEIFAGYMFSAQMTEETYLSGEKDFFKMKFKDNKMGMRCCLYHKDRNKSTYPHAGSDIKFAYRTMVRVDSLDYFLPMKWEGMDSLVSIPPEYWDTMDIDKLELVDMTDYPLEFGSSYYYRVAYGNVFVLVIHSAFPITEQFFDTLKKSIVIFK